MTVRRFAFPALAALLALSLAGIELHGQPPDAQSSTGAAVPADADSADDLWDFPDDEEVEVPTWSELVAPQALDLALFAGFSILALVGFFRKSVTLKYVTLLASVVYLGAMRSQLISITNVFALVSWNLPIFQYSLSWYFFAIFTVATTVVWGRLYCGRICAFGALTQLMDRTLPAKLRIEPTPWLERRAAYIKYVLLGGTLAYFLVTNDNSIYRWVEPFWMFTGQGTTAMWIALGVLLVATVFVRNLYCRFLCPVGAALGLLSNLTIFRIKRWSECKTCKVCEKACEWGAIQGPKIIASECVRCDDCERLYADEQKCPHWIIIRKKSEVLAAQAAKAAMQIPRAQSST